MCRAFYKVTHKIQLSNYVLNDIRLLEQIIQEVELFEMVKNTNVTSSANPVKKHVDNAINEISSAINELDSSRYSMVDYETENTDSMRIRLNF